MKTRLQWWERLNRAIFPYMGPAQLGPYGEPDTPVGPKPCPICGQRMDLHDIERGEGRTATRVFCPQTP